MPASTVSFQKPATPPTASARRCMDSTNDSCHIGQGDARDRYEDSTEMDMYVLNVWYIDNNDTAAKLDY